jgi:alpha-methylacyl-CoA racemase
MTGPLAGLRGVELAGIGPAPFAAMMLSDLGAEILRIEAPFAREPSVTIPPDKDVTLRGRPVITLDLKSEGDKDYLLSLCKSADFLIEGFRPGVMERLGAGPDDVAAVNPRLVFGRMTGWGQTGPMAQRAGHDIDYIALGGALYPLGEAEGPPPPPLNLVGDNGGGGLLLAYGILAACFEARGSGQGQVVDAAIVDGTASLMAPFFGMLSAGMWSLDRHANMIDGAAPWYRAYRTSDGGYIAVGAIETKFYRTLLDVMGLDPDDLPDQFDRAQWPVLEKAFATAFASRTRQDWAERLLAHDTCAVPVLRLDEMANDPHLAARGTVLRRNGIPQPSPSPRFSRTSAEMPGDAEAAEALLARWGVTARAGGE